MAEASAFLRRHLVEGAAGFGLLAGAVVRESRPAADAAVVDSAPLCQKIP